MGTTREQFDELETQATSWLVRLDAGRTPELLSRLEEWLARSRRHQVAYAKQSLAWKRMDILKRMRPVDSGRVDPDLLRPKRRKWFGFGGHLMTRSTSMAWLPRATVSVVLIGLIVAGASFLIAPLNEATYSTRVGGQQHVVLEDGSTVKLNTNTRIRVRFNGERRLIYLDRGEVLVSVAHDESRPLEVRAGPITSRAVGTKFSVRRLDDSRIETLVTEGRVLVLRQPRVLGIPLTPRPVSRTLVAAERVVVDRRFAPVTKISAREMRRRLMWTTGKITFEGEPLAYIVQELNRYNSRPLVILDARIANTSVGGGFDTSRADTYAAALTRFFGDKALAPVQSASPRW